MRFKNDGRSKGNILQNQFTAYLVVAVNRRRSDLLAVRAEQQKKEISVEDHSQYPAPSDRLPATVDQMEFKNELLEQALWNLDERERYIVFSRAITGQSFEKLAQELGLSYKGTAAIYYRAIKKIKCTMKGDQQ